jgi:hypothetical protein
MQCALSAARHGPRFFPLTLTYMDVGKPELIQVAVSSHLGVAAASVHEFTLRESAHL